MSDYLRSFDTTDLPVAVCLNFVPCGRFFAVGHVLSDEALACNFHWTFYFFSVHLLMPDLGACHDHEEARVVD